MMEYLVKGNGVDFNVLLRLRDYFYFIILGLFGSYAKNKQTQFSDIDVAYTSDYDRFSLKYKDGFSKHQSTLFPTIINLF